MAFDHNNQPMPGRDGVRVPLRRFFDVRQKGAWGYLIDNCTHSGTSLHVLFNFVLFPQCFAGRDQNGTGLNDMATLMERNHEDNLAEEKKHGDGYRCWSELEGKYKGQTLVLASCGPSLTESLPTLYRRRDEFKLMCLNRSLRPFQDKDAQADFYYFVERRGIPDWVHEIGWPDGKVGKPFDLSGVTMIGTPQCDPRIVRKFDPDKRFWGYTELGAMGHVPEMKKLKKFDVKAATTIGNAPFIAWKLGFKKLILVGCDFSLDCHMALDAEDDSKGTVEPTRMYFDKNWNQTHYHTDPQWIQRMLPVVGNYKRAVMLDPLLCGHRTYLEAVLDFCHFDGGMTCINASARGAMQFNNMPLDEALDWNANENPAPLQDAVRGGD